MPTNEHEKRVLYESFEGKEEIYAVDVIWKEEYVEVTAYTQTNIDLYKGEFLHEDTVAGMYPNVLEIPKERIFKVENI